MKEGQKALKNIANVALAALGTLFVLGVIFFKERVFFADASYILFYILDFGKLHIPEHRYGAFITQMFPWIGQKLNLPLRAIIISYALSFNFFYLTAGALLVYKFRQYGLAILMAMYYYLFVSDSYFWTNNEIQQAVAWMFLMFGTTIYLASKKANTIVSLLVFTVLAFFTVFTHFVVIIPLVFLWIYFLLSKDLWPVPRRLTLNYSIILALMLVLKFIVTIDYSYDAIHLHNATHFSLSDVIRSVTMPEVLRFLKRCFTNYWIAGVVFLAGFSALVKERKIYAAIWTLLSVVGYIIIMGITYNDPNSNIALFHIESEWASIGIIVAAPFVFTFLPRLEPRSAVLFLSCVLFIRFVYICSAIPSFSWRTNYKYRVMGAMRKKGINKLAINLNPVYAQKMIIYWMMPYEVLLMSAMEGDKPQLSFFYSTPDHKPVPANCMDDGFYPLQSNRLEHKYFVIDTLHTYQAMTHEELFR